MQQVLRRLAAATFATGWCFGHIWLLPVPHLTPSVRQSRKLRNDTLTAPARTISHEPLSMQQTRTLQELHPNVVIQQLDVLARSVLVLRGCHGASFEDCVFLLNVPLQAAIGAYCTAVEWYGEFFKPAATAESGHVSTKLSFAVGSLHGPSGIGGYSYEVALDDRAFYRRVAGGFRCRTGSGTQRLRTL